VLIKLAVGGLQKVLGGASIVWVNADADAQCAAANGAIAFPWPRNRTPVTFRTGKAFEKMKLIVSRRKKMEAGQVNPSVRAASHLRTSLAAACAHASAPMYSND